MKMSSEERKELERLREAEFDAASDLYMNAAKTYAVIEGWSEAKLKKHLEADVKHILAAKNPYVSMLCSITVLTDGAYQTLGKLRLQLKRLGYNVNNMNETDRCII